VEGRLYTSKSGYGNEGKLKRWRGREGGKGPGGGVCVLEKDRKKTCVISKKTVQRFQRNRSGLREEGERGERLVRHRKRAFLSLLLRGASAVNYGKGSSVENE